MWHEKVLSRGMWAVGLGAVLLAASCSGPGAGGNVAEFMARVQDEDAEVRGLAVQEAARQDARAVVPLGDVMGGEDGQVAETAREALAGLVDAVSGFEPWDYRRWTVADELVKLLDDELPRLVRAEALRLLGQVGTEQSVRSIAPLLADDELANDACQALQGIPGSGSTRALIGALETAPPRRQPAVIEALGARGDAAAVGPLVKLAETGDPTVSTAALEALARIGEPAEQVLSASAVRKSPPAELARIGNALVVYAGNRAARGNRAEALEIYLALLSAAPSKQLRLSALAGVGKTGGAAQTTVLLPYLADEDPEVTEAAIAAMIALEDREELWANSWSTAPRATVNVRLVRMLRFAEPVKRVGLLRVVAARNVPDLLDALMESAVHPEASVRQAAFEVLASRPELAAPAVENLLLSAARHDVPSVKSIALASYLRLADERLKMDREHSALQMYRTALPLVTDREGKLAVLGGMKRIAATDWVEDVRPLLVGEVAEEAVAACVEIASGLAAEGRKDRALAMLRDVAASTDSVAGVELVRTKMEEWTAETDAPSAEEPSDEEAIAAPSDVEDGSGNTSEAETNATP
ncbi:MAG: HEAT repeat domain-containing protein [Phycisphaerae bacterium]|nr:HEAT repeat domain-containing protein [Phycisphaerae bacterium]